MASKGYCTSTNVADWLGATFTAAQYAHCETLIEQAEIFIDEETGRGWLVDTQTDEAIYHPRYLVYLKYAPVDSITTITGRTGIGEDEETLTADDDYEVRDLTTGLIYLVSPDSYDRILVDYTPTDAVPADITMACTEIVANWMQPHLTPGMFGVDSYSLPDLTVKFSRTHTQQPMPPNAMRVIERYAYRTHA